MKDKNDILWGMYQEHTTQGRHHEVQRASLTNIVIVVAGGIIAFIAQGGVTRDKWIMAAFLIVLGCFGALFSAKQYERSRFHITAAGLYRKELESLTPIDLTTIRNNAEKKHKGEYPWLESIRLYWLWIIVHLLIAGLGVVLLLYIFTKQY